MRWLETRPEIRSAIRRSFDSELQFSYRLGNVTYVGSGRARDFNGTSLSFESEQLLLEDSELELRLPCHFALQQICPLELRVRGKVIRKEADVSVVRLDSCEFRTWGDRSFDQADSRGVTCNEVM